MTKVSFEGSQIYFMKILYIAIGFGSFIIYILYSNSLSNSRIDSKQTIKNSQFSLSLSTYNHAELISESTMTYQLKNDSFTITRQGKFAKADSLLFSSTIERNLVGQIMMMKLDTLDDIYINKCVMGTSGTEYHISIQRDTISKSIYLHHYFLQQIEDLIVNINKVVPEKYKIDYISSNTRQNCH